ncbi:MAG: hypothetical protein AB203_00955 [Parcubacteria bacterium C7867-008]|nr:MAG: hypothetical protein AB203_00955 [Parcubacteria bacterium C7867-008]
MGVSRTHELRGFSEVPQEFDVGSSVRIKLTGVITKITSKTDWGDYVLEGYECFFPGSGLEEV